MNISIKAKIYWSFFILVLVFVLNAIITFNALHSYKQSANHFSNVTDPSLQKLGDLNKMLIESKMYTTNWVFLRSNQEDKASLLKIHNVDYQVLKSNLNILSSQWKEKPWIDSLQEFYTRFESLLVIEKKIMGSLQKFEDYDDPVLKMEAEQMVEDELIPRTVQLTASLNKIIHHQQDNRNIQETSLMGSTIKLRILIGVLAIVIICVGIFLSIYLTNIIISPMKKIRLIINNLGKGITGTIEDYTGKDEIAGMVLSVNNLSEKIRATAIFAEEIGNRNFTTSFQALSDEDTLGRALITMRDNIKSGDEKLNDAQHIAHIGSWERDVKTDYMQFSDEMFVIFDIDPLSFDFQFQSIIKFIHPDDIEYMSRVSRENQYLPPVPYECRIITAKGVMKNIWVETKVVLGKHGEIEKTFGIVQDITERKIAAKKLEDANRELSILFNSIDEIFFSVNMTTLKVIQISPMCENLYGYTQSEFLDNYMLWIEIIHPDDKHLIENEDEEMLRGEQINNQYRIIRKDKSIRWVETKITPTLDNARNLIRVDGVTRDITERKKAEELLKTSESRLAINNQQLEQKNKELEQFAYVASHDLQEPLSTTISFVQLFKQQYFERLDPNADKYLTYIVQATERMRVLIKDLLDFSRIGHSKSMEKIDCNLILRDTIADIERAIKDSGTEIKVAPLPVIIGYRTEIKQLFQNLILNSIKFRKKNVPSKINIAVLKSGDYWEFAFNDNGIGIDQKHNERIFTIFQRLHTRSEYPGSGIGLSHCKKIVELHHGKIWVESTPNEGSTFYFTIHSPKEIINEPKIKLHHAN